MHNLGITEWRDERKFDSYPLAQPYPFQGLILDAKFVQFDGYVPVLTKISLAEGNVTLTIKYDTNEVLIEVNYITGGGTANIYDVTEGWRYIGTIVCDSDECVRLLTALPSQQLSLNIPFHPSTVHSIPSNTGVYSIAKATGDPLQLVSIDDLISFSVDQSQNKLSLHANCPPGETTSTIHPIRTINGVPPVNNSVQISPSEVIKISSDTAGLKIDLANNPDRVKITPKLRYA